MTGVQIQLQIDELNREISMRAGVYPKLVSQGKLRQSEATEVNARLRAAIDTLTWCRDNRALIAEVQKRLVGGGEAGPRGFTKSGPRGFTWQELQRQVELAQIYADDGALTTGAEILREVADEWSALAQAKAKALEGGAT